MIKINNLPDYSYGYNYTVARICDGEWWFWGNYSTLQRAVDAACEIGGLVFRQGEFEAGDK